MCSAPCLPPAGGVTPGSQTACHLNPQPDPRPGAPLLPATTHMPLPTPTCHTPRPLHQAACVSSPLPGGLPLYRYITLQAGLSWEERRREEERPAVGRRQGQEPVYLPACHHLPPLPTCRPTCQFWMTHRCWVVPPAPMWFYSSTPTGGTDGGRKSQTCLPPTGDWWKGGRDSSTTLQILPGMVPNSLPAHHTPTTHLPATYLTVRRGRNRHGRGGKEGGGRTDPARPPPSSCLQLPGMEQAFYSSVSEGRSHGKEPPCLPHRNYCYSQWLGREGQALVSSFCCSCSGERRQWVVGVTKPTTTYNNTTLPVP